MFQPQAIPVVTETTPSPAALPSNPVTLGQKLFWMDGRINRSSYVLLSLLQIFGTGLGVALCLMLSNVSNGLAMALLVILGLAVVWSMVMVTTKRFHDLDASGWWQVLTIVPLLGWLMPVYLALKPGTEGPNRYGQQPA